MISTSLHKIIRNSYQDIVRYAPIILKEQNPDFLFIPNFNKNMNTFIGEYSCGGCCYILHHYLQKHNIYTKMMKKEIGFGDYFQDHCYLLKDNMIIDPTYKQFFLNSNNPEYINYIKKLPFIFIGTIEDLKNIYHNYNNFSLKINKYKLDFEINDFWKNPKDISNILDMNLVIKDYEYATIKGPMYQKLNLVYNQYLSQEIAS
jgi:hypothetical protein